jgi:hypothetical protein
VAAVVFLQAILLPSRVRVLLVHLLEQSSLRPSRDLHNTVSDREPSSLPVHNHTDGTSGTDTEVMIIVARELDAWSALTAVKWWPGGGLSMAMTEAGAKCRFHVARLIRIQLASLTMITA